MNLVIATILTMIILFVFFSFIGYLFGDDDD